MGLGVLHHAVDVLVGQGGAAGDLDGLLVSGATVLRGHVHDSVGVDVEGDLDLRDAARGRRDAGQLEGAEHLVVPGELTLALEDLDRDGGLVVLGGREDLGGLGRDGRIALDELGHHAALGLDAEGERGDVHEQDVLALALDDRGLESGADGDDLVRVHGLVGLLAAGELLDDLGHRGHAGRAADEHHVVDVGDLDAGVLDHLVEGGLGALEQIGGHVLELRAGQLLVQVQRAVLGHREVLQGEGGGGGGAELLLRLLGGLLQALQGDAVLAQVHALLVLHLRDQPVDDLLVPVVAAQAVVAGGGLDLDGRALLVLAHLEQGDVEGAAAEVEDEDLLVVVALLEAVGEGRGGGLVDDAQDVQTRDRAGVLGGLTLGVREVGRDGDHRVGHGLAQVGLGVLLELAEGAGGDLLRGVLLVVDLLGPVGAHVALDGGDGAIDVGDGLALGDLADEDLALLGEGDDRRGGAGALGVRDDGGLAALEDGDGGVGGAEIDSDDTGHGCLPFCDGCAARDLRCRPAADGKT